MTASAPPGVFGCRASVLDDGEKLRVLPLIGKGSVQNIIDLDDGNSVLKLTVASYYRPSGKNIHRFKNAKDSDEWGVSPNPGMEVKLTPAQFIEWARGRMHRDLISNASFVGVSLRDLLLEAGVQPGFRLLFDPGDQQ